MNKSEKLICLVLGLGLAWYLWTETSKAKERMRVAAEEAAIAQTNEVAAVDNVAQAVAEPAPAEVAKSAEAVPAVPAKPEVTVVLSNAQMSVVLTTRGGAVKSATLFDYAEKCGPVSEENPPVTLDFAASPALEIVDGANLCSGMDYEIAEQGEDFVVFTRGPLSRRIALGADYRLTVKDMFAASQMWGDYAVSLGAMPMGTSKNDLLSIDSMRQTEKGFKPAHWCEEEPLKGWLVGGLSGGCSGSKSAVGMEGSTTVSVPGEQKWLAVKNRFFVSALASATLPMSGFDAKIVRDTNVSDYRLSSVAPIARFKDVNGQTNEMTLFLGPKKQALLWDLGMKDVMEFGMWRWLCYPLVWVLNLFHSWIPNFGIAIILLTVFVRLVFWPLTHKSTVGMKKMQEVQPLMKELQAKYKDNPQRLQQETWALYREKKVNPMSSCLPMLIQIPVFIALFNVLRSAVELRYAPFLWIADLSEPEALFASWFPFGGLNVLPVLMALTTGLQSAFTPSTGDKSQQKMMMIFMPVMMLVMFYSFPSALSLYWFLSNLFSIVQMWLIRRQAKASPAA